LIAEARRQGCERPVNGALVDEIEKLKEEWLKEWMPKLTSDEKPISPYRVVWDLRNTVDRANAIVTHDAGGPREQLASFYEAITPRGYLGWGHHSTLGFSLGGSIGAKLAKPEKLVVNVMGDGGFGMVGMDFETAAREKLPIMTIVLNNSGMGEYFTFTPTTAVLSGDYARVAEGLGGYGERVEDPDEIAPAIKRAEKAMRSGRPALLEMITRTDVEYQGRYWTDLYKR